MNNLNDIKVSIIIATYNRANSVHKSIESALNQTYSNVEVIVVDDGSTDNTVDVLKNNFGDKIRLHVFSENKGATQARNFGLGLATGEYSIVWDSDDILYPNAVQELLKKVIIYPDVLTFSAPAKIFKDNEEVVFERIPEGFLSVEKVVCAKMPKYKLIRMSKTEIHKEVLYRGKNLDFMINDELITSGKWFHLDKFLGDHFLFSDNESLTKKRRKLNEKNSIYRSEIISNHLFKFKNIFLENCPRRYTDHAYGATLGFILKGDISKARFLAKESWNYYKNFRNFLTLIFCFIPLNKILLKAIYRIF